MKQTFAVGIFCAGLSSLPSLSEQVPGSMDEVIRSAIQAQASGDWVAAASRWETAYSKLGVQESSSEMAASVAYEYGRSLGVICQFEQAEQKLQEALELDQKLNGPVAMSLSELARLNLDRGRYAEAIPYYERAVAALDGMNAAGRDPDAFGEFLEEYSVALERSGRGEKAKHFAERADKLKMRHSHSHGPDSRTPYGTQCRDRLSGATPHTAWAVRTQDCGSRKSTCHTT